MWLERVQGDARGGAIYEWPSSSSPTIAQMKRALRALKPVWDDTETLSFNDGSAGSDVNFKVRGQAGWFKEGNDTGNGTGLLVICPRKR